MTERLVAGCMTGTSMDALDSALVRIRGKGLEMRAEVVRCQTRPLGTLAKLLRPLAHQRRKTALDFAKYAYMIGMTHMIELKKLIGQDKVDLIALHGQTVVHDPPNSLQLINPHPVARELKAPVVFDLRGADISCGGQGAPITPIADHILFRDGDKTRVVINLGGFANYTWLASSRRSGRDALSSIRGGDLCACNQLLDEIARRVFDEPYDDGGAHAMNGQVDEDAHEMLHMMLMAQAEGGRSLGTGDEAGEWVSMFRGQIGPDDLARTACAVIAEVITQSIGDADQFIMAGGGTLNQALMREIASRTRAKVMTTDNLGVPALFREAIAMAILGALCADRVPITLPQITGCIGEPPVAGVWIHP